MAQSAQTNVKKLLLPITLAKAGWAIVEARDDVEGVPYDVTGAESGNAQAPRRRRRGSRSPGPAVQRP